MPFLSVILVLLACIHTRRRTGCCIITTQLPMPLLTYNNNQTIDDAAAAVAVATTPDAATADATTASADAADFFQAREKKPPCGRLIKCTIPFSHLRLSLKVHTDTRDYWAAVISTAEMSMSLLQIVHMTPAASSAPSSTCPHGVVVLRKDQCCGGFICCFSQQDTTRGRHDDEIQRIQDTSTWYNREKEAMTRLLRCFLLSFRFLNNLKF
jgi:hypothetical protein